MRLFPSFSVLSLFINLISAANSADYGANGEVNSAADANVEKFENNVESSAETWKAQFKDFDTNDDGLLDPQDLRLKLSQLRVLCFP